MRETTRTAPAPFLWEQLVMPTGLGAWSVMQDTSSSTEGKSISSVPTGTSTPVLVTRPDANRSTSACTAAEVNTWPLVQDLASRPTLTDQALVKFLEAGQPPKLSYSEFSSFVIPRAYIPSVHIFPGLYNKIVTPYSASAFDRLLKDLKIDSDYPLLAKNLTHSFPLGQMPFLHSSVIINNPPSTLSHMDNISKYTNDEITSGCMSGPFSKQDIKCIFWGPFMASPFVVAIQPQGEGIPDKIWVCWNLLKNAKDIDSVNSYIAKEDFPTRFDTASCVADLISLILPGTYLSQACAPYFRQIVLGLCLILDQLSWPVPPLLDKLSSIFIWTNCPIPEPTAHIYSFRSHAHLWGCRRAPSTLRNFIRHAWLLPNTSHTLLFRGKKEDSTLTMSILLGPLVLVAMWA